MVPYEPSPHDCPELSVKFERVVYSSWEGDEEHIPHVYYDHGEIGAVENLGPIDLEVWGSGSDAYIDGASDRAKTVIQRLGGSAWAKIAYEVQGHIAAETIHMTGRDYTFDNYRRQEDLKQAA
jgi:hypothetical protein